MDEMGLGKCREGRFRKEWMSANALSRSGSSMQFCWMGTSDAVQPHYFFHSQLLA